MVILLAVLIDHPIGGGNENILSYGYNFVEVYDPATDSWTSKSDMPTARAGLGTCVVDGKIYAIAGFAQGARSFANEVYNPATDTWTKKSPMQEG